MNNNKEYKDIMREKLFNVYLNWKDDEFLFDILETERPKILGEDNKLHFERDESQPRYLAALDVLVSRGQCTRKTRYE